jgi:ribonuclease R
VRLAPGKGDAAAGGAPGMGDRLLVRFEQLESGETEARLIKRLGQSAHKVLGVIRKHRRETRVEPVDRKSKESLLLNEQEAKDLKDGDLVLAQVGTASARYGPKFGKVLEVVGSEDDPRAASLIAIHSHGIPTGFSEEAEAVPTWRPRSRRRRLRPPRSGRRQCGRLGGLGGHRRRRRLCAPRLGPGPRRP